MSRALCGAVALAVVLSLAVPKDAAADASQLCRAFSNIILAPTDLLFAPVTTGQDMMIGFEDQDDHWLPLVSGTIPGYFFLNGLQLGGVVMRVSAGLFEIIPGIATLARDSSPKPLFTSQDEAESVYTADWGPCPARIGVHYNTIPWG